jgi:hypothetical protein
MLFIQSAAPTGWTRVTTFDDALLRIVGSATPGSGGTNGFNATFNAQTKTANFTISSNEIPTLNASAVFASFNVGTAAASFQNNPGVSLNNAQPQFPGGSAAHSHGITTAIKYVDSLIASKN